MTVMSSQVLGRMCFVHSASTVARLVEPTAQHVATICERKVDLVKTGQCCIVHTRHRDEAVLISLGRE